ncbi:MAG: glycosyltransferase family 4 protein, partial [Candidatus Dormibacteraeota bacterium]|nr:glycosyltransferase family 4 protein [Candidatus Dormibacteraeota bacterium]
MAALREQGHEVTVLTAVARIPTPQAEGVVRRLRLADVFDPELSRPRSQTTRDAQSVAAMWVDSTNVHALLEEIARVKPDAVYLWNLIGIGGLGLVLALEQLGVPWVWHLMDPIPAVLTALRGPWIPQVQRFVGRQIQGSFISCSSHVVEEARRAGFELPGSLALIPNWVTGPRTPPIAGSRREGPLRIMMGSVVTRFKGVDVLMEAAALLRERGHRDFTVDVYGRILDQSLIGSIEELELGDCFVLHGERTQDEVKALYREHDLLAFPTWEREAFAFAPLEAAAAGCLVLMTDRSGNAEWMVDGVHCLKAPRRPDAFADKIEAVMQGDVDAARIGARGQRAVLRDFHIEAVRPKIEAVLAVAAAGPR